MWVLSTEYLSRERKLAQHLDLMWELWSMGDPEDEKLRCKQRP